MNEYVWYAVIVHGNKSGTIFRELTNTWANSQHIAEDHFLSQKYLLGGVVLEDGEFFLGTVIMMRQ
jgi:hypothetical protein